MISTISFPNSLQSLGFYAYKAAFLQITYRDAIYIPRRDSKKAEGVIQNRMYLNQKTGFLNKSESAHSLVSTAPVFGAG